MDAVIHIENKPVKITLTNTALRAMQDLTHPLLAEMELYFSCLIRQKVRFYEDITTDDAVTVNDHLRVRFRPVMTAKCGNDYEGEEPPLTDFPISNSEAFIPKWLHIDYRHNQWQGEFGFSR